LDVAFFYLPTVTKPYLLKTTIPPWLSGAFFISLYIKAESTSGALSRGMNILSSKFELFYERKRLLLWASLSRKATYSVAFGSAKTE